MQLATAVVFGVVTGVLYGLAALGIVVVYRVSRVLNFALAGTASITSYEASTLVSRHWSYGAVIVAVLISGAVLGAACYGVLSLAGSAGTIALGVGTIGLLLIMQGSVGSIWGLEQRALPQPVSGAFHLGGINLSHFEAMAVGIALAAVFASFLLIYRTRLGLRMRAVSAGPRTAELLGINRRTTELWAWAIGGAAGSLAGLLIVPMFQLDQNVIITFMLAAFAAVVLGGFTSPGGVVLAGVFVSILLNILSTFVSSTHTNTFTFLIIAAVLFVRPHGLFGFKERSVSEPELPSGRRRARHAPVAALLRGRPTGARSAKRLTSPTGRRWRAGPVGLNIVVAAVLIYGLAAGQTTSYIFATALATFVAVLGVGTLSGLSGQVSLGQGAFVGIGAYTSGVLSAHLHISVWLALPLALLVGGVIGVVIGWPVARLSGVYLVVFTLAFGLTLPELLLDQQSFTGGTSGLTITLPAFMQNSRLQFLVALLVAIFATALFVLASRTQAGRRWRAVRDSEIAVAGLGWSPTINKVTAFAFGSALAALSGAMSGILTGYVSPDGYSVFLSIYLLVAVVIGGPGTVVGSMIGALVITLLPYYLSGSTTPELVFGAALVGILVLAPEGIANRLSRHPIGERVPEPVAAVPAARPPASLTVASAAQPADLAAAGTEPVLEVTELQVAYSGGLALHAVSLRLRPGEAVAVVGPNGAGKSTLLRAVSGWVAASGGRVLLRNRDITALPAHEIARLGVVHVPEGRCVFPDLTVRDNLALGYRSDATESEDDLLDDVLGIFPKLRQRLRQQAGTMSGGEQQMLAIGRGLMASPEVLMLDEPSLGLAPVVIGEMFDALSAIRANGVSVLLVEQNVHAALSFADRGYILSRGECVMQGPTADLTANDELVRAFLVQA